MLRHEHEDAVQFVSFVLKRLSEVRKMISNGKTLNEIKAYLSRERYELSAKLEDFRNAAPSEMFFVNRHTNDMNEKYSEMRQLNFRLQSLRKIQATVELIMKKQDILREEYSSSSSSSSSSSRDENQNDEIHEFRPLENSSSQESKLAISVFLIATATIVLVLTQGGRDWIAYTSERLRNFSWSSKRRRQRRRGKKSRSRQRSRGSSSSTDRSLSIVEDDSNDEREEELEEEEEEELNENVSIMTEKIHRFDTNDISTKGSPSPSPPQINFRTDRIDERKEEKKRKNKRRNKKSSSSSSSGKQQSKIKPLILPSDHDQNENENTLTMRVEKEKKTFPEEKEVEFTFTAISKHPSPEKETKKKKDTSKERKSFADVVLKNQKTRKVTPCRSLLLAISASKISNPFTSQYHHILCMKKSSQVSQQWKISVKIPESLRFVRYRYAFASEEEEEDALNLDKNFVNIKWEVVPDRYLDTQSKYNNTLLSAGSLEFQNNVNVLSRKLITQKIKTKSMWKRRRRNLSSSSSSKLRLRASSTEWYPVYHARTTSPTTSPDIFFGEC